MVETRSNRRRSIAPSEAPNYAALHAETAARDADAIQHYTAMLAAEKAKRSRNVLTKFAGWVRDLYLWTIFSFAIYMLDTWERCLVWLAVLTISVLTLSSLAHVLSPPVQLPTLARLLDFAAPSIGR